MDSTLKKKFVSQSIIAGLRVQKEFPSPTLNSYLSLFPYYSLILVEKKYAVDYRELTGEKKIPGRFHSFGMNVSVQTENGILFCNMKYILGMADKVESQDLKTFIYTIGTLVAL